MRDHLKLTAGWLFVLAFLALPNCGLPVSGLPSEDPHFNPGFAFKSSAIFCDIESMEVSRHCASDPEISSGRSLSHAAVDLVLGNVSNIALDFSEKAIADAGCDPGQPVAIRLLTPFPTGQPICLNCGSVIGPQFASVDAACIAICQDLGGSINFCSGHAHASTNAGSCFANACHDNGEPIDGVLEMRKTTEAVSWQDLLPGGAVSTSGPETNTLTRDADTTTPDPAFDAGAASDQTIEQGDGWVEFIATETDTARICGLSTGGSDSDQSDLDIDFGIRLTAGGHVLIEEKGVLVVPPNGDDINFWFADYEPEDRFRVTVTANPDGTTANIEYFLIKHPCAGAGCTGTRLRPIDGDPPITAPYPFRVDASLRDGGATLTDVRIVRIK